MSPPKFWDLRGVDPTSYFARKFVKQLLNLIFYTRYQVLLQFRRVKPVIKRKVSTEKHKQLLQ